jgi:predicted lipoprotein with Yx(FWY)xxD motif
VKKTSSWAAAVALAVLTLAGCGSSGGYSGVGSTGASTTSAGASATTGGGTALSTADSDLGPIVVDSSGRTVYVFDKDTSGSGSSACSGGCAQVWPAVTAESDTPSVEGVSGKVGTIARDDGTKQVTLDGLPLYTYAEDSAAGDVTGQGVQGVWWVVAPDGTKIAGQSPPPAGY